MWLSGCRLTASFGIFLVLLSLANADNTCPDGAIYNSVLDKCYWFAAQPLQFTLAEQNCVLLGGHLTAVLNGFENTLVTEDALQSFVGTNQSDFWTGGNDLTTPGTWAWIDGSAFVYSNWNLGEPSTSGDCISVSTTSGKWTASNCFDSRAYVCSIPKNPGPTCPPVPSCPTLTCPTPPVCTVRNCPGWCPSEWSYFGPTDSCYKVFFEKKWNDAEAECVSQSAHLASVHSDSENTFICNLAKASEKLATDRMTWIGLQYRTSDKKYVWTDGSETDYLHWAPKQPDSPGKENCIEVYSDQSEWPSESNWYEEWNDYDCNKQLRNFVCKQPAGH